MKNTLLVIVLFAITYFIIHFAGGLLFTGEPNENSLQSAVTFAGVNYLAIFIYIIIAAIATTILFFTIKSKRSK